MRDVDQRVPLRDGDQRVPLKDGDQRVPVRDGDQWVPGQLHPRNGGETVGQKRHLFRLLLGEIFNP